MIGNNNAAGESKKKRRDGTLPSGNAPPVIETENLCFTYAADRPGLIQANLCLRGGRIIGLAGPNGSGKTTLMKLLAGMLQPQSGRIRISGHAPGPEAKACTAYLPDRSFMANWMRIDDLFYFYEHFFADFERRKAEDFMKLLKLREDRRLRDMSQGEKERLAVALTMSRRVKLYLLDEPIAAVDPVMRELVFESIIRDVPEDALVLMSTHLLAEAETLMDQVIFMQHGEIIRIADSETLRLTEGQSAEQYYKGVYAWY